MPSLDKKLNAYGVALISPGPLARFWGGKKGKERVGRTGRREGRGGNKRG